MGLGGGGGTTPSPPSSTTSTSITSTSTSCCSSPPPTRSPATPAALQPRGRRHVGADRAGGQTGTSRTVSTRGCDAQISAAASFLCHAGHSRAAAAHANHDQSTTTTAAPPPQVLCEYAVRGVVGFAFFLLLPHTDFDIHTKNNDTYTHPKTQRMADGCERAVRTADVENIDNLKTHMTKS